MLSLSTALSAFFVTFGASPASPPPAGGAGPGLGAPPAAAELDEATLDALLFGDPVPGLSLDGLADDVPDGSASPPPAGGAEPGTGAPPAAAKLDEATLDALLFGDDVPGLGLDGLVDEAPAPVAPPAAAPPGGPSKAELDAILEEIMGQGGSWDHDLKLGVGTGYRDNPLLSAFNPQESYFQKLEVEALGFRLPRPGQAEMHYYLWGEYTRFNDVEGLDDEAIVVFETEAKRKAPGGRLTLGGNVQLNYIKQAFDISLDEIVSDTSVIEYKLVQVKPLARFDLGGGWSTGVEVPVGRYRFRDASEDYGQVQVRWEVEKTYGHRSKAEVYGRFLHRVYDERAERSSAGFDQAGSELVLRRYEAGASLRHYWDAGRSWQTRTRLRYRVNEDSGSGYFDYAQVRASQRLGYERGGWEVTGEISATAYDYPVQTIGGGSAEELDLKIYRGELSVRREVTKNWKLFFLLEREQNESNRGDQNYDVNTVTVGLERLFD